MAMTLPVISSTETQALNGSNFGPWYGPVYLENVMCNGTERFGFQCNTPGPGVIANQECYNPNRTAGVRCIASMFLISCYKFYFVASTKLLFYRTALSDSEWMDLLT